MCAANDASRGGMGPTLPNKTFPFLPICSISRKEVHRTAGQVGIVAVCKFVILPNYRMINYYSIFTLSSGVTCYWCI